jgi:hypothetical protein
MFASARERRVGSFPLKQRARMARWPRHVWTSIITYLMIFGLFPLLCLLAWAWVRGLV